MIDSPKTSLKLSDFELNYLFSIEAIQTRAQRMLQYCLAGNTHFSIDWQALDPLADLIIDLSQKNYPDGKIPLHSRWRHFFLNQKDYAHELKNPKNFAGTQEQAKAQIDLAIISVLLDAGAGNLWQYHDAVSDDIFSRSEGLALATLRMFLSGFFSSHTQDPWRVDATRLASIHVSEMAQHLQSSDEHPLLGIEQRTFLLNQLAKVLSEKFPNQRPSGIIDLLQESFGIKFTAAQLLQTVLKTFHELWPKRLIATNSKNQKINLGDVWWYPPWGRQEDFAALMPFHKLSSWLSLSLIEALQTAQFQITQLASLPGLAEYRNGGLMIDSGLLFLKNKEDFLATYHPGDTLIIEWRGLTLALLEQLAIAIRYKLKKTKQQLPLVNILEGGTWLAGRQLAEQKRSGSPPFNIHSDGTLF
jgi:hypothetical protein